MNEAIKLPYIESNTNWNWDCPKCGDSNDIELDGDGFAMPIICENTECQAEFDSYEGGLS